MPSSAVPAGIVVLYGSQGGTASDVALWLASRLRQFHEKVACDSANSFADKPLKTSEVYIFVVSTSGNGEFPLNASRFWERLKNLETRRLPGNFAKFAVFGLGDSKYTQFNFAARKIYGRMIDLGGCPICQLGCGDDQHALGYSQELIPWVSLLWKSLFGADFIDSVSTPMPLATPEFQLCNSTPRSFAKLVSSARMASAGHFQEIRQMEFMLMEVWNYEPGDVLVVLPKVSRDTALRFICETLRDEPTRKVFGYSLEILFTEIFDITSIPSHLFYELLFASFSEQVSGRDLTDEETLIRDKLSVLSSFSAEGANERLRYSFRERMTVWEVLGDFHQVRISVDRLVGCLPRIAPRYYSVSAPVSKRKERVISTCGRIPISIAEIAVASVDYTTLLGRHRTGLASSYLKSLAIGSSTNRVWMQRGFNNGLSARIKSAGSLILFGPGTGVAPIRAIALACKGIKSMLLFSGFRNETSDFIFEQDLRNHFHSDSTQVAIAWSRPNQMDRSLPWTWSGFGVNIPAGPGCGIGRKTWVQDLIGVVQDRLEQLLADESTVILIAGRSHPMPQQIIDSLETILGKPRIDALSREGRIVYDTWG